MEKGGGGFVDPTGEGGGLAGGEKFEDDAETDETFDDEENGVGEVYEGVGGEHGEGCGI